MCDIITDEWCHLPKLGMRAGLVVYHYSRKSFRRPHHFLPLLYLSSPWGLILGGQTFSHNVLVLLLSLLKIISDTAELLFFFYMLESVKPHWLSSLLPCKVSAYQITHRLLVFVSSMTAMGTLPVLLAVIQWYLPVGVMQDHLLHVISYRLSVHLFVALIQGRIKI